MRQADLGRRPTWIDEARDLARRTARIGFAPKRENLIPAAIFAFGFAVLCVMTVVLYDGQVYGWEVDVTRWIQDTNYPDWLFHLTAGNLTNSDSPEGAIVISGVVLVLWLVRLRLEAVLVALVAIPLHIIVNFPKIIVERARPSEIIDGINGVGGMKSFPSGHSEFAITFYGLLVYFALLRISNAYARAALVMGWAGMALVVGYARIEAGKHWPLDVIAGYIVGMGTLAVLIWLHRSVTRALAEKRSEAA